MKLKEVCGEEWNWTTISCFSDTRRDHLGYLAFLISNGERFRKNSNLF